MEQLDTSRVYTEEELLDMVLSICEDPIDYEYEKEVSDFCLALTKGHLFKYCSEEGLTSWCSQWIKNMTGHLATKGFVGFGKVLDSTEEHTRKLIGDLQNALKNKSLNEDYINERFAKFDEYRKLGEKNETLTTKAAVEYSKQYSRFEGLLAVCESIVSMAESNDEDSFASDSIWDNLAGQTNTVAKVVEPKPGLNFKSFKWEPPFIKSFDYKKSEWYREEEVASLKEKIFEIKKKAFVDLIEAAKHLEKLCKNMQAEVQHVNKESGETMAREYARSYLVSKLIMSVQALILKEIGYFCTIGIKKLGIYREELKQEEDLEENKAQKPEENPEKENNKEPENKEQ